MATRIGSFSTGTTGNVTVSAFSFPNMPEYIELFCGPQTGTIHTTTKQKSTGRANSTNQSVESEFEDTSSHWEEQASTSNCILLRKWDSGSSSMVDRVKASFVSFNEVTAGSQYSFTLNFSAADANRQIRYIVHG